MRTQIIYCWIIWRAVDPDSVAVQIGATAPNQLWVRSWRPSRPARLVNAWVAAPAETVDGLIRVGDDDQRQADVVELVEDIQVGGGAVLRLVGHQFGA